MQVYGRRSPFRHRSYTETRQWSRMERPKGKCEPRVERPRKRSVPGTHILYIADQFLTYKRRLGASGISSRPRAASYYEQVFARR